MRLAPDILTKYFEKDMPISEMAERMHCSTSEIYRKLRKLGLSRPVGRPTKIDSLTLNELYHKVKIERSVSMDEAATVNGVTKRTLQRKFKAHEVQCRSRRS